MIEPANDDLKARAEAFVLKLDELKQRAARPGLSEADLADLNTAIAANRAEGEEVVRLQLEEMAALRRQLRTLGFPTVRRVVDDNR